MTMIINKIVSKINFAFLVTGVLAMFIKDIAWACTAIPVTPWFTENLGFVETDLPSTVVFSIDENQNIAFENMSGSSFYFQERGESKEIGSKISFRINIIDGYDMVQINGYLFSDFDHRNRIEDNRPSNIVPPHFQDIVIPITLEEKQYSIKLRLTYEVNHGYIPNSVEGYRNWNGCRNYSPSPWAPVSSPLVIGGLALLLSVVLVVLKLRPSFKTNDNKRK